MANVTVPQIDSGFRPVALDIKTQQPSGFGGMSLGDIVNMATTMQSYQKQKELLPYEIEAGKAKSKQMQIEAEKAGVDLNQHYANLTRGLMGGFLSDPDFINGNSEQMAKKIQEASAFAQKMGVKDTGGVTQQLIELAKKDPAAAYQYIKNGVQQAVGVDTQYKSQQPSYMTNAAGQILQVTPGTGAVTILGEPGAMGGATLPKSSAVPGTPQMPPQGVPAAPSAPQMPGMMPPQQAPAQTINPSQAQATFAGQSAQVAGQDWASTYDAAKIAPQRIAVFQNIKKLVPESYTGALAEKKQIAANLAQSIGIDYKVLESSSTDELAKNTKLLQLAGGNTDAARQIAELANPNTKMTKEGINRVVDQLIGIEKMNVARANYLGPYSSNQAEYSRRSAAFNQVADPRLFQEMTPQEVAKLKASLSPAQQLELTNKIRAAKQMGIIQ